MAPTPKDSGRLGAPHEGRRIDHRVEIVPARAADLLKSDDTAGRDPSASTPLGDRALADPQRSSYRALATSPLYRLLHNIFPHSFDLITEIDSSGNTGSDCPGAYSSPVISTDTKSTVSTFWERLCKAAADNGVATNQTAIAKDLKIRQSAVNKWAKGVGYPNTKRLKYIAERYKYNVEWLLRAEGPERPVGVGEPDDVQEVLSLYKSLPYAARRSLLDHMRMLRQLSPPPVRSPTKV